MGEPGQENLSYGVIVLAAGSSRRMGRPKLLLPWGDTTVLGHLIETWRSLLARQIVVVCATDARAIGEELDRLRFPAEDRIFNPDPERGMFSSIQRAAAWGGWKGELTHWMIALGDQPHLRAATLQALLDFGAANRDRICQPSHHGRARHPVLLPKPVFDALKDHPAADLKQFLASHADRLAVFESDDAGLDFDMDTPSDYARALQFCFNRGG
ncbi:MAG: nucleotidyltransferase family protein [Verrucomicrobiota bacterium]|jgi:molybdenum cofactor cytidylyltransferase